MWILNDIPDEFKAETVLGYSKRMKQGEFFGKIGALLVLSECLPHNSLGPLIQPIFEELAMDDHPVVRKSAAELLPNIISRTPGLNFIKLIDAII